MLIGLAGIALWAVIRFGHARLPEGQNWPSIAGGVILLGAGLVFIRGLGYASESASAGGQTLATVNIGYGAFIVLIAGVVAACCAVLRGRSAT